MPLDKYSFVISFCVVPANCFLLRPLFSAVAIYKDNKYAAGAFIVIDVFIFSKGILSNNVIIFPMCDTGTPTLPTSPFDNTKSESYAV